MSPKRTRDVASEITEESVRCRTDGHHWLPVTARRSRAGIDAVQACDRCNAERTTTYTNRGHVLSRRIRYPEHYLSHTGKLTPDDRDRLRMLVLTWDYPME